MALTKQQKKEVLNTIEDLFTKATSLAFVKNNKLTVQEISAMRREMREHNAKYVIAKKTLIRIAMKNVHNLDLDGTVLEEAIGVVVSLEDPISGMGVVNKYANEKVFQKEKKLIFMGGFFEGKLMNKTEITRIAALPSRETLLTRFLMSLNSPLSGFARFLSGAKDKLEENWKNTVSDLEALKENNKSETPE